jgi:membrane protein YqaA with SNARE-associated domain
MTQLVWRLVLVLVLLFAATTAVRFLFGGWLNQLALSLVDTIGLPGVALGTWLADGFAFPVPPQTYMLAATSVKEATRIFPALVCGSLLGGVSAYYIAPPLFARIGFLRNLANAIQPTVESFDNKRWLTSALIASLSPLAFSWVCYAAGVCRAPLRVLLVLCILRIPKLLLFQAALMGFS